MSNFLYLILEGVDFGKRKLPKTHAAMSNKVSVAKVNIGTKKRFKRIIPRKSSLLTGRTLIDQTNRTRSVWDPKGDRLQKYLGNMYRTI